MEPDAGAAGPPAPGAPPRSDTSVWSEAEKRWVPLAEVPTGDTSTETAKASPPGHTANGASAPTVGASPATPAGPAAPQRTWGPPQASPPSPASPHKPSLYTGATFVTRYLPPEDAPRELRLHPADAELFDEMIAWRAARPHAGLEECLAAFAGRTLAPDLQIYTNANALARTMYAPFYPDLVLVFEADALPSPEAGKRAYLRDRYEDLIVGMGIIVEREPPRPHADPASALAPHRWFVKLWIPFETMCKAAEELMLRMPFVPAASVAAGLEAAGVPYKATQPFERDLLEEFVGGKAAGGREWEVQMRFWEGGWRALAGAYLVEHLTIRDYSPDRPKARLNRLLGDGVYTDFYPPHSGPINGQGPGSSSNGLSFLPPPPDDPEAPPPSAPSTVLVPPNPRVDLHRDWARVKLMWRKGWRQPLDDVRKYFGERIAWYFAWAGFYTLLLIPLSAFAFVVFIYGLVTAATGGAFSVDFAQANLTEVGTVIVTGFAVTFDNALTPWYGIALCAWATIAFEYWKRRTSALSFAWDTGDFKHSEVTRPEWIGTNTRRSTVTGRFEQYAPDGVQQGLRTLSWCLVGLSIGVVVLAICGFIAFQAWAIRSLADYPFAGTILPALLSLVSIVVLDGLYKKLVVPWLLQIENWKKESEYENSYIIKVFLFDFVNLYGSLFYIGVVKPWVSLTGVFNRDDWKDTCAFNSCMAELMIQLVVIFLARQWLNSLVEWVLPRLKTWWNERKGKVVRDDDVVEDATRGQYISDAGRIKYERADLWADYTKIIAQYGYISLFSVAFPLAAPLALFNNLIEIRSDASRLVLICQRPFFRRAKDQGVYDSVLSVISYMSVMFNALIISFSSTAVKVSYLDRYGPQNALAAQFGFALAFTGVVLVVSKAAELVIPDVSKETKTAMEREEYLVGTKFFEWREAQDVAVPRAQPSTWEALQRLMGSDKLRQRKAAEALQADKNKAGVVLEPPPSDIDAKRSETIERAAEEKRKAQRLAVQEAAAAHAAWSGLPMSDELDIEKLPPTQRYRLQQQRRDRALGVSG